MGVLGHHGCPLKGLWGPNLFLSLFSCLGYNYHCVQPHRSPGNVDLNAPKHKPEHTFLFINVAFSGELAHLLNIFHGFLLSSGQSLISCCLGSFLPSALCFSETERLLLPTRHLPLHMSPPTSISFFLVCPGNSPSPLLRLCLKCHLLSVATSSLGSQVDFLPRLHSPWKPAAQTAWEISNNCL